VNLPKVVPHGGLSSINVLKITRLKLVRGGACAIASSPVSELMMLALWP
jgi:hypothetical protein